MTTIIKPVDNRAHFLVASVGDSKHMRACYNTVSRSQALDFIRGSCERLHRTVGEDQKSGYDKLFWSSPEGISRSCPIESIGKAVDPVSADNTYICGPWRFVLMPL